MTKILVTGGNGQLGQSIKSICHDFSNLELVFTDVQELDITNLNEFDNFVSNHKFDYLINCAAYTAVDKAESDVEFATILNAEAVKNIATIANKHSIKVIHVSTDYVFDGKGFKPYGEDDATKPESVYGQTKLLGEEYLHSLCANAMTIRTAWLYSEFGNNFVKTMIKLGTDRDELRVVADQVGSPTYAVDLADAIMQIIDKVSNNNSEFVSGIYHYSNEGICSWYDFAVNIHQLMGITCNVSPIASEEYPTPAPRPYYSVLSKSKIKTNYDINISYWRISLERCLNILQKQ